MNNIPLVIPSYKPESSLISLIESLNQIGFHDMIVVRDGGGAPCDEIFETVRDMPGITLLVHAVNLGKGRAMKTAFNFILQNRPSAIGCITLDADGQHLPSDVLKVAEAFEQNPDKIILGCRGFEGEVPWKSRVGNRITSFIFLFLTGLRISDTQTGLRGLPLNLLRELMTVHGERYEYETNMLLHVRKQTFKIKEVPIQTVYIESNRGSHFNPLWDSMKIYFILLRYGFSGVFSAFLDYLLFFILMQGSGDLLFSVVTARGSSLIVNYILNKRYVFSSSSANIFAFPKFVLLCFCSLCISYAVTYYAGEHGFSVYWVKILIDSFLFFVNFSIQRIFIFTLTDPEKENDTPHRV